MSDRRSKMTFERLSAPLDAAIRALVQIDERARPFVVVMALGENGLARHLERAAEDGDGTNAATFVQFCTNGGKLIYDCPPLSELNRPCAVEDAVKRARDALERQGVQPAAQLELLEHTDELIPRRTVIGLFIPRR